MHEHIIKILDENFKEESARLDKQRNKFITRIRYEQEQICRNQYDQNVATLIHRYGDIHQKNKTIRPKLETVRYMGTEQKTKIKSSSVTPVSYDEMKTRTHNALKSMNYQEQCRKKEMEKRDHNVKHDKLKRIVQSVRRTSVKARNNSVTGDFSPPHKSADTYSLTGTLTHTMLKNKFAKYDKNMGLSSKINEKTINRTRSTSIPSTTLGTRTTNKLKANKKDRASKIKKAVVRSIVLGQSVPRVMGTKVTTDSKEELPKSPAIPKAKGHVVTPKKISKDITPLSGQPSPLQLNSIHQLGMISLAVLRCRWLRLPPKVIEQLEKHCKNADMRTTSIPYMETSIAAIFTNSSLLDVKNKSEPTYSWPKTPTRQLSMCMAENIKTP